MKLEPNKIYLSDCLKFVKQIPSNFVDCIITSPPYFQMIDYGYSGQWGQESSRELYLKNLWALMDETKRVLKDDGTCFINLGDTYGTNSGNMGTGEKMNVQGINSSKRNRAMDFRQSKGGVHKSLMMIPHRFAIGCEDRGWIVRNDLAWIKPNACPESVKDRFSKRHEYIFFMVKSRNYYFDLDAIRDALKYPEEATKKVRMGTFRKKNSQSTHSNPKGKNPGSVNLFWDDLEFEKVKNLTLGEFWDIYGDCLEIGTRPSGSKQHFASFNTKLLKKLILAACPKNGLILDPFMGIGTTAIAARQYGRNFIGCDANAKYVAEANENIKKFLTQNPKKKVA